LEGRKKQAESTRRTGLYAKTLSAKDQENYAVVEQHTADEIFVSSFNLVHARIKGVLDGQITFPKQARLIIQVAEAMVLRGDISEDFLSEMKLRLANFDVERMSKILSSTIPLANAAAQHSKLGEIKGQRDICFRALAEILKESNDSVARRLVLSTISEMKLEHGLSTEEMEELMGIPEEVSEETGDIIEDAGDEEIETSEEAPSEGD
jgi:hypothetical protein